MRDRGGEGGADGAVPGEGEGEGAPSEGGDGEEAQALRYLEDLKTRVTGEVTVTGPPPGFHTEEFNFPPDPHYKAELLYDFSERNEENRAEFVAGDEVVVLFTNDQGWCRVRANGRTCFVPQNHLRFVKGLGLPGALPGLPGVVARAE